MSPTPVDGARLFAQYAHAPNALGYCGPAGAEELRQVAAGTKSSEGVEPLARRFSGAWPYQQVLASLAGIDDPLDSRVVRGYWTGNELTDHVDARAFGAALLAVIGPQAGSYWTHLNESLLDEAAPTHAFHVLSVYPWSRLLGEGRPEPLFVLDSCRISWATVLEVEGSKLRVERSRLSYDGALALTDPEAETVEYRRQGEAFFDRVEAGDTVAVHWGHACDVLTDEQAHELEKWTRWQLDATAPRLRAAASNRPGSG